MNKTYPKIEDNQVVASEPTTTYDIKNSSSFQAHHSYSDQQILAKTISVDEYFDELISQVNEDYENL